MFLQYKIAMNLHIVYTLYTTYQPLKVQDTSMSAAAVSPTFALPIPALAWRSMGDEEMIRGYR